MNALLVQCKTFLNGNASHVEIHEDKVYYHTKVWEVHKRTVQIVTYLYEFRFDGDSLNILLIINEEFRKAAEATLNPANAMIISKNDGMFNQAYNHQRDTIINANTVVRLSRDYYTPEQIARIRQLQGR